MKLIFIYGAPGVGKLTVAKELAKLTEFKLFHNHLTTDLLRSIFERTNPIYLSTLRKLRLKIIAIAAKNKIPGLIMTFVHTKGESDNFVKSVDRLIRKHGGKMLCVHLLCDQRELFRRVKHPSRKRYREIKTIRVLKSAMKEGDMFSDVDVGENLSVDNTRTSPKRVAILIKKYYKL